MTTKTDFSKALRSKIEELLGQQVTIEQARRLFYCVFDQIEQQIKIDHAFNVPDFGVFRLRGRPARRGVNPQTGEPMEIPAKTCLCFRVATKLASNVAGVDL